MLPNNKEGTECDFVLFFVLPVTKKRTLDLRYREKSNLKRINAMR